jgi:hypothetical protein
MLGMAAFFASCSFDTSGSPASGELDGGPAPADAAAPREPDAITSDAAPEAPRPVHHYRFDDGTAADSVGGAHGTLHGDLSIEDGRAVFSGGADGGWIELPAATIALRTFEELTFEAWFSYSEFALWQRVFDFGGISASDENHGAFNVFFTPTSGFTDAMAAISSSDPGFSNEARARADSILAAGLLHHVAVTLDDEEIRLYHDGELIASATYASAPDDPIPSIAQLDDSVAYLGRSTYGEDDLLTGEIVEFAIFDVALTPAEILARFENAPAFRSALLPQYHHAEIAAGDDIEQPVAIDVGHGERGRLLRER